MGPPDLPHTTSASQLSCYVSCPRKYSFRYIEQAQAEFRSTALILGSAVHGGIGWYFEERLAGHKPTIEDACSIASIDVVADVAMGGIRWRTATAESLDEEARRLVTLYLESMTDAPVVQVERKLEVGLVCPSTGEVFGRPLVGYLDLVLADRTVVEIKTASRAWSEFDLPRNLQLGAYAFALRHEPHTKLAAHVLVKLKREPRLDVLEVNLDGQAQAWWLAAVSEIERAIAAHHFPPTPSPLCHQCEYERACARRSLSVAARVEQPASSIPSVAFAM